MDTNYSFDWASSQIVCHFFLLYIFLQNTNIWKDMAIKKWIAIQSEKNMAHNNTEF